MKKQLNHNEAVEAVYAAIAHLRLNGVKKISFTDVSSISGVSRATLYTDHDDWKEVRDVIKLNKITRRVKEAKAALGKKEVWERDLDSLQEQVELYENQIYEVKNMADAVYSQLLGQLHKYVLLSTETPAKLDRNANNLKELAELRQRVIILEKENSSLKALSGVSADIRVLSSKEVINVDKHSLDTELSYEVLMEDVFDIVNLLDDYFSQNHGARTPKVVHLMCGNYASGKSSWIKYHKPNVSGVNLYIDGTNHVKAIRKALIKRVRKLSDDCIIVCVRRVATLNDCINRNKLPERSKSNSSVNESLLNQVESEFDELTIDEGFDEIVVA